MSEEEQKTFRASFRPSKERLEEIARNGFELMESLKEEEIGDFIEHVDSDDEQD